MANEDGSNNSMAFIVGGLVVAVGVMAYLVFGGGYATFVGGGDDSTTVKIETNSGSEGAAAPAPAPAATEGAGDAAPKN